MKWTDDKIRQAVEVLRNHTSYQEALDTIGETADALYNAFKRHQLNAPTEYLAQSEQEVKRSEVIKASSDLQTLLVFNDVHIPFHNEAAVRNVWNLAKELQPDDILINGDFLDCYTLSSFPKQPGIPDLQAEIDLGAEYLYELRSNCPNARIKFLEGNHEYRLKRVIREQAGLFGLRDLVLPKLLNLEDLGISYHDYEHSVDFNGKTLSIVHGSRVRKHAGHSGKAQLEDNGYMNVIIGHTHRMGSYYHDGHYGRRRSFENGGLFDKTKFDYIANPNWQNGFCVIYLLKSDPEFIQVVPVEMNEAGTFVWQGQLYQS